MTSPGTGGYGPARARQVRLFLWLTAAVALVTALFAAVVLLQGGVRFGLFLAAPAVAALVMAVVAVSRLDADGVTRPWAVGAGVALVLVGIVTATLAFGFLAIIVGLLTTMLALLSEPDTGH